VNYDLKLTDYLSECKSTQFEGDVYRATRAGLDPVAPSNRGGRWAPNGTCPVLYTSLTEEGALAEISYHWAQLTPIPSKPIYMHKINVVTENTIKLVETDINSLKQFIGLDEESEYSLTQQIGAAIEFLGFDGLIAPSARWNCDNLILYANNHDEFSGKLEIMSTVEKDWKQWAKQNNFIDNLSLSPSEGVS